MKSTGGKRLRHALLPRFLPKDLAREEREEQREESGWELGVGTRLRSGRRRMPEGEKRKGKVGEETRQRGSRGGRC